MTYIYIASSETSNNLKKTGYGVASGCETINLIETIYILRYKRQQPSCTGDYPSPCPTVEIHDATDRGTLQLHTSDIH